MRFAPIAAASVIALGALLGVFTTSSDAHAQETVQQRTVASSTEAILFGTTDNNGNG